VSCTEIVASVRSELQVLIRGTAGVNKGDDYSKKYTTTGMGVPSDYRWTVEEPVELLPKLLQSVHSGVNVLDSIPTTARSPFRSGSPNTPATHNMSGTSVEIYVRFTGSYTSHIESSLFVCDLSFSDRHPA
jgi:hypothetical protein